MVSTSLYEAWAARSELTSAERAFLVRKLTDGEPEAWARAYVLVTLVKNQGFVPDEFAGLDASSRGRALKAGLAYWAGHPSAELASDEDGPDLVNNWYYSREDLDHAAFKYLWGRGPLTREMLLLRAGHVLVDNTSTWVPWWLDEFRASSGTDAQQMAERLMTLSGADVVVSSMDLADLVKAKTASRRKLGLERLIETKVTAVLARVVRDPAGHSCTREELAIADGFLASQIQKTGSRNLVASELLDEALVLVRALTAAGMESTTEEELHVSRGRLKGTWEDDEWPTADVVRARFSRGVVDETTFAALLRLDSQDPLRAAMKHASATPSRVATLLEVEDLEAVLEGRTPAWRRTLLRQVWPFRADKADVVRALLADTSDAEVLGLLEKKALGQLWGERVDLMALLGARAELVLERTTLSDLNRAPVSVVDVMLERLHSTVGHNEAALEAFAVLSETFEGTFGELLEVCSDL